MSFAVFLPVLSFLRSVFFLFLPFCPSSPLPWLPFFELHSYLIGVLPPRHTCPFSPTPSDTLTLDLLLSPVLFFFLSLRVETPAIAFPVTFIPRFFFYFSRLEIISLLLWFSSSVLVGLVSPSFNNPVFFRFFFRDRSGKDFFFWKFLPLHFLWAFFFRFASSPPRWRLPNLPPPASLELALYRFLRVFLSFTGEPPDFFSGRTFSLPVSTYAKCIGYVSSVSSSVGLRFPVSHCSCFSPFDHEIKGTSLLFFLFTYNLLFYCLPERSCGLERRPGSPFSCNLSLKFPRPHFFLLPLKTTRLPPGLSTPWGFLHLRCPSSNQFPLIGRLGSRALFFRSPHHSPPFWVTLPVFSSSLEGGAIFIHQHPCRRRFSYFP